MTLIVAAAAEQRSRSLGSIHCVTRTSRKISPSKDGSYYSEYKTQHVTYCHVCLAKGHRMGTCRLQFALENELK